MSRFNRFCLIGMALIGALCAGQGCPTRSTGPTGNAKAILPQAVSPDVEEFPDDEPADTTERGTRPDTREAGGRYCALGNTVIRRSHFLVDRGLALAHKLNEDVQAAGGTDPHLTGTLPVRGTQVAYKADFSAFDIDGNGTADGSGQPQATPIAVRLWVDPTGNGQFVRFLCALITTRPSVDLSGAGQLYAQPGVLAHEADREFHIFVKWDHTDAAHKTNEAFVTGSLGNGYVVTNGHVTIDVATLTDQSVQKTLKSTTTFSANTFGVTEFDYATRTIAGSGFALVNTKVTGGGLQGAINACISLESCTTSGTGCSTIDTTGMDFLAAPTGTETNWPAAFPEQPTF